MLQARALGNDEALYLERVHNRKYTFDEVDAIHYKKFAELLIKECARIARATPCPYEEEEVKQRLGHTWDMASLEAGRSISKHFGLEK